MFLEGIQNDNLKIELAFSDRHIAISVCDTFTAEVYGHLELISRERCRSRPVLVSLKTVHGGRVGGLSSIDDKQRVRSAFERAKNGFRNSLSALYMS